MHRGRRGSIEHQVGVRLEIDAPVGDLQRSRRSPVQRRLRRGGLDRVRLLAAQTGDDRAVAAVTLAGPGQRPEQHDLDARELIERSLARKASMNAAAALIGPTVCDDDGPMPILNRSNMLIMRSSTRRGRFPCDLLQQRRTYGANERHTSSRNVLDRGPPQHDRRLGEHGARAHADRKRRGVAGRAGSRC